MKIKYLLFALFMVFIFASCYQAAGPDTNANGGSLLLNVNGPMRAPVPGADGEIRIKFFEADQLEEGKAYIISNRIDTPAGATTFPDDYFQYLNVPTPLTVNGKRVITSYLRNEDLGGGSYSNTTSGKIEIDKVPAGISLKMLVEYIYDDSRTPSFITIPNTRYLSYVGVSEPFTVKKDSSATVNISSMENASPGVVLLNSTLQSVNSSEFLSVAFMDTEDFDSTFTIDSSNFIKPIDNAISDFNNSAIQPKLIYKTVGYKVSFDEIFMLPGKKLKLIIINWYPSPHTAGISQPFELAP